MWCRASFIHGSIVSDLVILKKENREQRANMKYLRCFLFFSLFLSAVHGFGQDRLLSQAEQMVLDNPEVIMLEFAPLRKQVSADVYEKDSGPFKPASTIRFNLMGTNTSFIELWVRHWDTYAQNKPRLFRDNQEVPYREDIAELIKERHTKHTESFSVRRIKLNPNEPRLLQTLILSEWYAPLGPGHYELSTERRFMQGGKWVKSAAIVFEVEEIQKPKY